MSFSADLSVSELLQAADRAGKAGRQDEADRIWQQVLTIVPDQLQALGELGQRAMQRGDLRTAMEMFKRAAQANPKDIPTQLSLSHVLRLLGDAQGALNAVDAALAADPYFFAALLTKATLLEQFGKHRQAAKVFKNAITIAPPETELPPEWRKVLVHAREVVRNESSKFERYVRDHVDATRSQHNGAKFDRLDECLDVMLGKKKVYTVDPQLLHFPRLPAIQFYDRTEFPWLDKLEAATDTFREELLTVMREDAQEFEPYIAYAPGTPVNQWGELNHSPKWTSFFLWRDGERIEAHCKRCPRSTEILASLPMAVQPGFAPTAIFSHLQPHTHIPAHTGSTNARLVVHLPLILPEKCRFRVGNDTREWKMGEAWVFDDTIEHEAWNDSDQLRVILIIDIWNPYLTQAERDLVCTMMSALQTYYAEG